eukprot:228996-Hanusia_phi.AAC.7
MPEDRAAERERGTKEWEMRRGGEQELGKWLMAGNCSLGEFLLQGRGYYDILIGWVNQRVDTVILWVGGHGKVVKRAEKNGGAGMARQQSIGNRKKIDGKVVIQGVWFKKEHIEEFLEASQPKRCADTESNSYRSRIEAIRNWSDQVRMNSSKNFQQAKTGQAPARGLVGTNFRMRTPGNAECRVFVGNLDIRLNEGAIVKLFQQFGKLKRCDYLWFTSGPRRGQPRGKCFLEFESAEAAEKAIARMNGKSDARTGAPWKKDDR